MKRTITLGTAVLAVCLFGCGKSKIQEPKGKPVTLTQEDRAKVKWSKVSMKKWSAWHMKGVRLANEGRLEEALFCFHRAQEAWPKKTGDGKSGRKLRPEPTDTYLQKANLYLKMKKPKLALHYFERFLAYFPGNKYALKGKQKAQEMLSTREGK